MGKIWKNDQVKIPTDLPVAEWEVRLGEKTLPEAAINIRIAPAALWAIPMSEAQKNNMAPVECLYLPGVTDVDLFWKQWSCAQILKMSLLRPTAPRK